MDQQASGTIATLIPVLLLAGLLNRDTLRLLTHTWPARVFVVVALVIIGAGEYVCLVGATTHNGIHGDWRIAPLVAGTFATATAIGATIGAILAGSQTPPDGVGEGHHDADDEDADGDVEGRV